MTIVTPPSNPHSQLNSTLAQQLEGSEKKSFSSICLISLSLLVATLTSCSVVDSPRSGQATDLTPALASASEPINSAPLTYAGFVTQTNYPKTSKAFWNHEILNRTTPENSWIKISLSQQRAFLMNGEEVALDYPVSTGKTTHPTPAGTYEILERITDKRSNLYGKIYDSSGNLVNSSADSRKSKVPEGGKFVGAAMPYWMRLTWTGIGMHVGNVPRYPASHACIRGQEKVMPTVFSKVRKGTTVTITQ